MRFLQSDKICPDIVKTLFTAQEENCETSYNIALLLISDYVI